MCLNLVSYVPTNFYLFSNFRMFLLNGRKKKKYRNKNSYYNNIITGVRAIACFQYSTAWYYWKIGICVIKRFHAILSSMEWVNHPLWYPFTLVANKFFYSFFYFFSIFSYCFIFHFLVILIFGRINVLWNHIDSLDSCPSSSKS